MINGDGKKVSVYAGFQAFITQTVTYFGTSSNVL